MKYLVLKGCAGLGNRFITLMKAINYCRLSKRTLYVDWADGMFGAKGENVFFEYFELNNVDHCKNNAEILKKFHEGVRCFPRAMREEDLTEPVLEERNARGQFVAYMPTMAKHTVYKVALSIIPFHKFVYMLGLQSFQRVENVERLTWWKVVRTMYNGNNFPLGTNLWPWLRADIVLFADFRPLVSMRHFFDYLHLKDSCYAEIKHESEMLGLSNAIGIHVRYTDKKPKAQLSVLHMHLQSIFQSEPTLSLFLCSDNQDVVDEFAKKYPGKVILYHKFIPKVEDGGIHIWAAQCADAEMRRRMFDDSVKEMWLLSMTKTLFWQGNSSFSYISKLLRDKNGDKSIDWMKLK